MYDYVGYEVGVRSQLTAENIIQKMLDESGKVFYARGRTPQSLVDVLPSDLKFIANHDIDWGIFSSRWGRIQGFFREFLFSAQLPENMLGSFSLLVSSMRRMHNNYYVHCQILIYYFFLELLPVIASLNPKDRVFALVHELCNRDGAITLSKLRRGYFGQYVFEDKDMKQDRDDFYNDSAEVLAEDE